MKPQKRTTKTGTTRWIARYTDPTGKERSKTFNTQRDAKIFLQEQERAVRRNEWIAPTNTTVADLVGGHIHQATNDNTRANRQELLKNLGELADMNILTVKPAHTRQWIDTLTSGRPWASGKPLAVGTVTTYAGILHGVFTQAVLDDVIPRHPMRGVKIGRVNVAVEKADVPTMDEVRALVEGARGTGVGRSPNVTLAALVQVAAETGMRAGEICGLRVRNVDFLRGEIAVVEQMHQRTGDFAPLKTSASRRVIPINDSTKAVIEEQLRRVPRAPHETVFANAVGKPFMSAAVGAQYRRLARAVGVSARFHDLRHFYASTLIAGGASVVMVQRAMGHATASMTLDIYSHLFPGAGEQLRGMLPAVRDFSGISGENAAINGG